MSDADGWREKFQRADRQVLDQIRQRHDAASSLAVVEDILAVRCQHATDDNADLRSALLELRIVRAQLDPRPAVKDDEQGGGSCICDDHECGAFFASCGCCERGGGR